MGSEKGTDTWLRSIRDVSVPRVGSISIKKSERTKKKRSRCQEFGIQDSKSSGILSSQWPFSSTVAVTSVSFVCAEAFSHGLSAHTFSGKWSKQQRVEDELFSFLESSLSGQSLNVGGKELYLFVYLFIYCITETFSFDVQTPYLKTPGRK